MRLATVATSLLARRASSSVKPTFMMTGVRKWMISPWMTQRPKSVTTVNSTISRTIFSLLDDLNVYFLFAKKLNTKATEVDKIFANNLGTPKIELKANKSPKSSRVFSPPIRPNLNLVPCFFISSCMVFFYEVQRSIFSFIKYSANIFTNNSQE